MFWRPFALCALLLLTIGAPAEAKTFFAEQYDSRIEVLRGGTLRVVETVTLRFDEGTFTQFYRAIPARSTDGIEVVSAALDGQLVAIGEGPGHIQISRSSGGAGYLALRAGVERLAQVRVDVSGPWNRAAGS